MIDHRLGGSRQGVGMVLEKPASAGFLLPAIFAVGEPADAKSFLTPEFLPLTPLFEHEHVRYSERLTRGGGTWLFPNLNAA
ncbi:hypothetical protein, partial [Pseudomonas savastanoi]|uniref:hypothetical protein n=1 Tax=Pseudomonas savastanoi TaxID=29438 RepID=UPI0011C480C7